MKKITVYILTLGALPLVMGCSNAKIGQQSNEPTTPHLVDLNSKSKELMSKSPTGFLFSGALTQVTDALQNIPSMAMAGHDFKSVPSCLWNDGKVFTGLRVQVQGSAFSKGLLGQPQNANVKVRSELGKGVISESSGVFMMTGTYSYTATIPAITCQKIIEVSFDVPAIKEGEGDYQVIVGPLDDSTSPVTFKHALSVSEPYSRYAERASSVDSYSGGSNSQGQANQGQSNNEPKTQYELQLQQAAEERNRSRY